MEPYFQEKPAKEVEHYQNKDFLKAAMAAFVLIAHADGSMASVERCRMTKPLKPNHVSGTSTSKKHRRSWRATPKPSKMKENQPRRCFTTRFAE